jgi:Zn-dependent protease
MSSYNPYLDEGAPLHHAGPPRLAFSRTELVHLSGALVALTVAFAFVLPPHPSAVLASLTPTRLLIAFVAVATGFVLHELAHKVLAQRYGHWAEFRAQFAGLAITIAFAAAVKFLFAAPGAVLIQGRVTPRENGLISLVGPATNFVIAGLALGGFQLGLALSPTWGVNADALVPRLLTGVAEVNGVLAVFNLVPLGPLDGAKVWRWSKSAYAGAMLGAIGMLVVVFITLA